MTGSHPGQPGSAGPGVLPPHETPVQQTLVEMSPRNNTGRDTN